MQWLGGWLAIFLGEISGKLDRVLCNLWVSYLIYWLVGRKSVWLVAQWLVVRRGKMLILEEIGCLALLSIDSWFVCQSGFLVSKLVVFLCCCQFLYLVG